MVHFFKGGKGIAGIRSAADDQGGCSQLGYGAHADLRFVVPVVDRFVEEAAAVAV